MTDDKRPKFKVFITKYALTTGIFERDVEHAIDLAPGMVCVLEEKGGTYGEYYHGEGREWHRTKEGAIARAEEMRKKKLASLRKSIKSIEALKF